MKSCNVYTLKLFCLPLNISRQIALKALSERLSKTSDHHSKDRQPLLPKSGQKVTFVNPPTQQASSAAESNPATASTSKPSTQQFAHAQANPQQTMLHSTSTSYLSPQPAPQLPRSMFASFVPPPSEPQSITAPTPLSNTSKSSENST